MRRLALALAFFATPALSVEFPDIPIKKSEIQSHELEVLTYRAKKAFFKELSEKDQAKPALSSSGSSTYDRLSENDRFPILTSNPSGRYIVSTTFQYDVDFYEKRSDFIKKSALLKEKSYADLYLLKESIYLEAVRLYVEVAYYHELELSLRQSATLFDELYSITEKQVSIGIKSHQDLHAVSESKRSLDADILLTESAFERSMQKLSALYGEVEIKNARLTFEGVDLFKNPPSNIRKSLLDVEISLIERAIQDKKILPDVYFGLQGSISSVLINTFLNPASLAFSIGPSFRFERPSDHESMRSFYMAHMDEMKARLDQSWKSIRDESALLLLEQSSLEKERLLNEKTRAQLDQKLRLSKMRFDLGLCDYTEVIRASLDIKESGRSQLKTAFNKNLLVIKATELII